MKTLLVIFGVAGLIEAVIIYCLIDRLYISSEKLSAALNRLARFELAPTNQGLSIDAKFLRAMQANERKEERRTPAPVWMEDSLHG